MYRREFNRLLFTVTGAALFAKFARGAELSPPAPPANAVDCHAHIFQRGIKVAAVRRYLPDYDATLDDYLSQLDTHGIARGVLVQPSFLGTDNSYLLAALKHQSKRLRGIVVVDPQIPAPELDTLAGAGAVGIRLNLVGAPLPDFSAAPWPEFIRKLIKLDWAVQVHREARDLPRVVGPLLDAGAKVVVDHFGRPDPKLGIADPGFRYLLSASASRRLWVKLSGAYRNGPGGIGDAIAVAAIPPLRDAFGPERLVWGSDWPHTQFERVANYSSALAEFNRWITSPAERRAILQTTPSALYHFDRRVIAAQA